MDSVTQMALGAAVGELVLGRRIGNRGMLLGALVGSLPDLDVLVPFEGAVESFTYHRSFSHSLIVLTLLSPLIALILQKIIRKYELPFYRWWFFAWLALFTHALLDGFTVYGTQLFWPFSDYPVSGSSVFIIDPVYTLVLLVGLLFAFRRNVSGHHVNSAALVLATLYLGWSLVAKNIARNAIEKGLSEQSIRYDRLLTTPMPFTTLGWRYVAMQTDGYTVGYYSLFDPADHSLASYRYSSDKELLAGIENHWPVQRLKKFTHGFFKVQRSNDEVQIVDLRMGIENAYIFAFTVGEFTADGVMPVRSRAVEGERDFSKMKAVMQRVFNPMIDLEQR